MRLCCDKIINAIRIFWNNLKHTKVIMKVHIYISGDIHTHAAYEVKERAEKREI
jgi:hypothetical protein